MQRKLLLSFAVISMAAVAHADGDSMHSLSYRVKENEFRYDSGVEVAKPKFDIKVATSRASFENTKVRWINDLAFGVTDSFSVGVGLDLSIINTFRQTAATTGTTFSSVDQKNNGFEDIRLNSSYRYSAAEVKADLLVGFAYSGKAEKAASVQHPTTGKYVTSAGDAKSGGSSIQLGTQFSGAMGSFEWATMMSAQYNMRKKAIVVGGDQNGTSVLDYELKTKSALDLILGVSGQYNINTTFALETHLDMNFAAKREYTYFLLDGDTIKSNNKKIEKAHTDIKLALNGKYLLMANVALGLNYSHLFAAKIDGSIASAPPALTTKMTGRKDDRFGFDVAVRF